MTLRERITVDPTRMGGVACVRGLRVPVATVLQMLAQGLSADVVLKHYPYLEPDDIRACLVYAAEAAQERVVALDPAS